MQIECELLREVNRCPATPPSNKPRTAHHKRPKKAAGCDAICNLDDVKADLFNAKADFVETKADLFDTLVDLVDANVEIYETNAALVKANEETVEAKASLHATTQENASLTANLQSTRSALETTTAALETSARQLVAAADEINVANANARRATAERDVAIADARRVTAERDVAVADVRRVTAERDVARHQRGVARGERFDAWVQLQRARSAVTGNHSELVQKHQVLKRLRDGPVGLLTAAELESEATRCRLRYDALRGAQDRMRELATAPATAGVGAADDACVICGTEFGGACRVAATRGCACVAAMCATCSDRCPRCPFCRAPPSGAPGAYGVV